MDKFTHGGNVYEAKRFLGKQKVIDFSANINPLGLSTKIKNALIDNIEAVLHYPDAGATELRSAICKQYGVKDRNLMLGNGVTELLYLLMRVLKPKDIILPVPSFNEYERAALQVNPSIHYVYLKEEEGFKVNFSVLEEKLIDQSLIILGNPNNPIGNLLQLSRFEDFLKIAEKRNCNVMVDESFIDFLPNSQEKTTRGFIEKYDNLYILHSMTKFFAIPGLRLGFGIFPPDIVEKLYLATDCWNVNVLAQIAGKEGIADKDYIAKSREKIIEIRERFLKNLLTIKKIKVYPTSTNFFLINIDNLDISSDKICKLFAQEGILVRNCANFIGLSDKYIRIAINNDKANEVFYKTFKKIIKELDTHE